MGSTGFWQFAVGPGRIWPYVGTAPEAREMEISGRTEQAIIWNYYKPRHTHAWNMLVLAWQQLERNAHDSEQGFDTEYRWENFIIRLWLYRTTIRTLVSLKAIETDVQIALAAFDAAFIANGNNQLKALRDMIEHFDDYAAGRGRGPADRVGDLDPWRSFSQDRYERGKFVLDRQTSYDAAIKLRADSDRAGRAFIEWLGPEDDSR